MARLHLIVGPVGAGKSTFARQLAREHQAVRLILDDWMAGLYGADERPATGRMEWYQERTQRCIEQLWALTLQLMKVGASVVLELGLIQRHPRQEFFARVDAAALPLSVYVLDAPREVRRARVEQRNLERGETFAMEVPPAIFELASDLWQPLDEDECSGRDVRYPEPR